MFLYWQLSGEVSAADRTLLALRRSSPGRGVTSTISSERLRRGRWPLLQRSSWQVYDQYLKANRVEAGIRSYGLVVTLILRAQFDEELETWPRVKSGARKGSDAGEAHTTESLSPCIPGSDPSDTAQTPALASDPASARQGHRCPESRAARIRSTPDASSSRIDA